MWRTWRCSSAAADETAQQIDSENSPGLVSHLPVARRCRPPRGAAAAMSWRASAWTHEWTPSPRAGTPRWGVSPARTTSIGGLPLSERSAVVDLNSHVAARYDPAGRYKPAAAARAAAAAHGPTFSPTQSGAAVRAAAAADELAALLGSQSLRGRLSPGRPARRTSSSSAVSTSGSPRPGSPGRRAGDAIYYSCALCGESPPRL